MPHQPIPPVTHQTVRLARGKHTSPNDGACVMELASMLAGERFTDHPRSVSPVIAAFLRVYNDMVDRERRADLYAYAAASVGTRGPRECEEVRADICRMWLESRVRRTALDRVSVALRFGALRRAAVAAQAASYAGSARARHEQALALVDALIAVAPAAMHEPSASRKRPGLPTHTVGNPGR